MQLGVRARALALREIGWNENENSDADKCDDGDVEDDNDINNENYVFSAHTLYLSFFSLFPWACKWLCTFFSGSRTRSLLYYMRANVWVWVWVWACV